MARNRMLNPEFWLDEEVSKISPYARLLYMGLWGICDDNYATFPDRSQWIKAQVFPYENIDVNPLLEELSKIGKIIKFEHEGKNFWFLKNFLKHQRVDRPSKPKYPEFKPRKALLVTTLDEYSTSTRPEVKRREENITETVVSGKSKNMQKYQESRHSSDDEEIIDLESGERMPNSEEKKKKNTAQKYELIQWAEKRLGKKFFSIPKQLKALETLKNGKINPEDIKRRWIEMENSSYWKGKMFDFINVANSYKFHE